MENYDKEISNRSNRLRLLIGKLETESEILSDWTGKSRSQESVFNEIVAEKELEEASEREERILLFMMNRAAVIIQRVYRRILARRKSKRKAKQKKLKK